MKLAFAFLLGVFATVFVVGVVVPIYGVVADDPDTGWERQISVQRHEKTGVSTVCVHSNPTIFTLKTEGEPEINAVWKPNTRYYGSEFLVEAAITPKTCVSGVMISRLEEGDAWDGIECTDEAGNRWRCVWIDEEHQETYRKHPDLRMVRRVWFGSVTVDSSGTIVFHEDGSPDNPHVTSSVWHLVR